MLYLVSHNGIDTNNAFISCDDPCFVVSASSDDELASVIASVAIDSGFDETYDINGSEWEVRELGEGFNFKIEAKHIFSGKRN